MVRFQHPVSLVQIVIVWHFMYYLTAGYLPTKLYALLAKLVGCVEIIRHIT
jgi:hypothetical protein